MTDRFNPVDFKPERGPGLGATLYQRIHAERDCWYFMADPDSHKFRIRWATMQWFAMVFAFGGIIVWDVLEKLLPIAVAPQIPTWAVFTVGLVVGLALSRDITRHEDVQCQDPQLLARYKTPRERIKTWLIILGVPLSLVLLAIMIRL